MNIERPAGRPMRLDFERQGNKVVLTFFFEDDYEAIEFRDGLVKMSDGPGFSLTLSGITSTYISPD